MDAEGSRLDDHPGLAAREARKRGDVDSLLDLLAHTDRIARIAAAQDLGALKSTRAVGPLVRCLQANDELLQVSALKALANIGDRSVVQDVFDLATGNEPPGVRATAAETLGRLGDRRAIAVLSTILSESTNPYPRSYRKRAAKLLLEFRGTEALPTLEAATAGAGPMTRLRLKRIIKILKRYDEAAAGAGPRHA
jgi:HEAT repeat protein